MNRLGIFFLIIFFGMGVAAAQTSQAAQSKAGQGGASNPAAMAPDNELCVSCHGDIADKVKKNVHGAVACQSCHVKHEEYPHPEAVAKPACSSCHKNKASDYAQSVHARANKAGKAAPDCGTCHGKAHELESTKTPQFRAAVPGLCGACHVDVAAEFQESVHGAAVQKGIMQAAVCTDCHGEHSILEPNNAASSVNARHVRDTCAGCHSSVQLARQFGLPNDRIVSFDSSYHGLASKSGAQTVANCASCHGVHNIRASSDPKSTINSANLAKTCGHCHQGAGTRFALGKVHTTNGNGEHATLKWVRWFYLLVIPLTIGFMFLHNFGDWLHKVRRLRFNGRMEQPEIAVNDQPLRTLPFERIQHAALAISFIVLCWTGFALKYPEQWWARPLLVWEGGLSMRGIIHRSASVVFMAAALAHVLSLIWSKALRDHWYSLLPKWSDLSELSANFLYNIGFRKQNPGRSSHSYVEKLEYWALVWGSVVMVLTGVLLWGNTLMLRWLPKILLDLSTSVHFYEAVLASLAILFWHFYFVVFDPDVYPMDSAWLTGKSPRKEPGEAGGEAKA